MSEATTTCDQCGIEIPTEEEQITIYPETYCFDCFDGDCARCGVDISDADDRVQKFDDYFCTECAERLCYNCGKHIEDLDNRNVIRGLVRCNQCKWHMLGNLCCGCGTDISNSTQKVAAGGTHRYCADCKKDLPDDVEIEEYPFDFESPNDNNEEQDAPF
ncbi:hypothetical protein ACFO5R_02530 [Halosolutus amylolyticus]|uniref:Uncharacterized protein n=1 Tax=Halosolutus amylolyticus TaxID=2932267 RepID=A0ABD5PKD2_9EURY|nr:hypothetical protein [Halosolutus amylolyticus]